MYEDWTGKIVECVLPSTSDEFNRIIGVGERSYVDKDDGRGYITMLGDIRERWMDKDRFKIVQELHPPLEYNFFQ